MDFLEVDKEIPDQKYTLVSFLCPDTEMKKRELYMMEQFKQHFIQKCKENFEYLENELKDNLRLYDRLKEIRMCDMHELYDTFLFLKKKELDEKYDEMNQNKCSIMGLKIRGSYPTIQEAKNEAMKKQKTDKNHNIYICQTGYWVPFSPNSEEIANQEYANEKLNEIMKNYNEHLYHKNEVWDQVTKLRIQKAYEEGQQNKNQEASLSLE
jgi:hypothetical protein